MAAAKDNARPIIIRRVKKVVGGHHGGAWKVAYADFVTAMMAFFMLLWLISNPDKERLKGLAEYFSPSSPSSSSTATGDSSSQMPGAGGRTRKAQSDSTTTIGQPSAEAGVAGAARGGTANVPDASMRVLAQELRVSIDSVPDAADARQNMKVESTRDGMRISLMDSAKRAMFQGSTAQLNGYAREMLARVAAKLLKSGAQISIEGHTDATGGQSDANWRLSSERALAARSAMIAAGLTPDRFSEVVGKAATQPVYPDQPDRPENRRITVVVLGEAPALPTDSSFKF
jgi:chemotaxis protein MotB